MLGRKNFNKKKIFDFLKKSVFFRFEGQFFLLVFIDIYFINIYINIKLTNKKKRVKSFKKVQKSLQHGSHMVINDKGF